MKMLYLAGALLVVAMKSTLVVAVTAVSPNGVNVRSTGPTTVFLTFQNTGGQQPADAFWCGDITVPANTPTNVNPCVPGTLFGHLPARNELSRSSGTSGFSNTTDIMTIPPSVARRAYIAALEGEASQFFYVRKFVDAAGVEQYIAVTCRMAGGGARVPLALTNVDIAFDAGELDRPIQVYAKGSTPQTLGATIHYNGSGRLKGRWEAVRPGDLEPEFEDLLTEASLPVELRGTQRRYTFLSRFDRFLPPTGEIFLPGPDPSLLPTSSDGPYKVLLRIEASADKEGNSDALVGTAISGGVAGFPMPVLRYYVGASEDITLAPRESAFDAPSLLFPHNDYVLHLGQTLTFTWAVNVDVAYSELELARGDEAIFAAVLADAANSYTLPPWVDVKAGDLVRWRVNAKNESGETIARSIWRRFQVQ